MRFNFNFDTKAFTNNRELLGYVLPFCREVKRRISHPFFSYKPDDSKDRNQFGFHQAPHSVRLVYGGNQAGKSFCVAMEVAWYLTRKHPYFKVPQRPRIYAISASYRTLQEGIWRHLKRILPEWMIEKTGPIIPGWSVPYYVRMKNGAQIDFISGEGREDARRKIQAAELDLAVVDEEVDELLWQELLPRRLVRAGRVIICATLVRSEPWTMELEDRAETGDPEVHLTRLSTYAAGRAGHVQKKIIREMETLLTEDEKEVRLLGKSRKSEGLVYPELTSRNVVAPFEVPRDWTRFMALDPGFRTFGVLWAAVAPDEKCYIYHELYLHAKHYSAVANAIFAANGYQFDSKLGKYIWDEKRSVNMEAIWIDPTTFGHFDSGELKTGNLLCNYGLQCSPSQNDVEAGIQLVRRALMDDLDGVPRLRIFRTCENLLKEMRNYRRHKEVRDQGRNQKTEAPIKRNDHLCDCIKYLCLQGLYYRKPPDPWLVRERMEELQAAPQFHGAPTIQMALQEEWRSLMSKEKSGLTTKIGLGSEQ